MLEGGIQKDTDSNMDTPNPPEQRHQRNPSCHEKKPNVQGLRRHKSRYHKRVTEVSLEKS